MANLEQAAMTTLQSGVDPYPKDIPEYEERNMQNWMSYIPQTAREYPAALGRARKRETKEIESGIPETYRKSAQEGFRRGIPGSGVQIEQVGLAGIDLQNRIAQARSREEIDPMQAQIALEDRAKKAYVDRGKQELADFQRQEDVTTAQRAADQLMKARLAAAGIGLLGGTNPLSSAIFGGKGQEGLLQKAIGGIGSLFGAGTAEAGTTNYNQLPPTFGGMPPVQSTVTPKGEEPFTYGMGVQDTTSGSGVPTGGSGYDPDLLGSVDTTDDYDFAMEGNLGTTSPVGDISPFGTGMDAASMQMPQDYYGQTPVGTEFTSSAQTTPSPSTFSYAPSSLPQGGGAGSLDQTPTDKYLLEGLTAGMGTGEGGITYGQGTDNYAYTPQEFPGMFGGTPTPTYSGFETEVTPFLNRTLNPDVYDVDFDNFLGPDLYEEDYFDFSKASGTPSTDVSEAMRKAMDQGFANAEITQKLLDEGKIGTEYASLLSDASDYVKDTLPESGTDLLSTAGDIAKLPFQALDVGMKAVGSAKKAVSDLTTKALDTATGGAYSGIKGLGGQATKAVSEALGGVVSPSTVGSLALTALRGTDGLKSIAKDPFGFAGKKILSSALPSLKSTVGALAKGSLPSLGTASFGSKVLASNIAYDAALAKGLSLEAARGASMTAFTTTNPLLAASAIAIPMLAMSIGSQQTAKQRAKAVKEEMINRAGSAPFNFVPGELYMVGNKRTSPVLEEASRNFMVTDQLTGLDKIYTEDPRRSVMGGDSLSKRGQDFAKEAGIDYKHSDPDVKNTSQKWLGKQQLYSELIPELKPIFMAGLRGEMSREETEDAISFYSNKFFKENPAINQINGINKAIEHIEHQEADDLSSVQNQIMALKEQAKQLYQKVPLAWRNVSGLMPQELKVEFIEEEQE